MKPCPFCGKSRQVELWDMFDAGVIAHILCEPCGAHGPSVYVEGETQAHRDQALSRARRAWDKREKVAG
jgi:Restriction alleviation protein Lar